MIKLIGAANTRKWESTRDKIKYLFDKEDKINVLYPKDLFMETL